MLGTALGEPSTPSSLGPKLPTYKTAARVLEGSKGSGLALVGWTMARTVLIAPAMQIVGVPWKKAWAGALLASGVMSIFVLLRLFNARRTNLEGLRPRRTITRR